MLELEKGRECWLIRVCRAVFLSVCGRYVTTKHLYFIFNQVMCLVTPNHASSGLGVLRQVSSWTCFDSETSNEQTSDMENVY